MVRITTLIIGVVLVGMFVTGFGFIHADLVDNYGGVENDTDINFASYNQSRWIDTEEIVNSTEHIQAGNVGGIIYLFKGAYDTVMITAKTFNATEGMINMATSDANLGGMGGVLKSTLLTIVIVLIFLGVIVSVFVKWWL